MTDRSDDTVTPQSLCSRRTALKAGVAAAATSAGLARTVPARAAPSHAVSNGLSQVIRSGAGFGDWSVPSAVDAVYRYGEPTWLIRYADGERSTLESWWESSAERHLIRDESALQLAVVAAPPSHIGVSWRDQVTGNGLASLSYIDSVDLDFRVSLADPVTPAPAGDVDLAAGLGWWSSLRTDESSLRSGLAFEDDMPAVDIKRVREVTNCTADDFGGVYPDTSGLEICVIDTGVNAGQVFEDDLGATRIVDGSANFVEPGDPTVGEDGPEAVADGSDSRHGTWVIACTAGRDPDGELDGYAPAAALRAHKALGDDGSGATSDILAAIREAADAGADVIALSLGSPVYSVELDRAVSYATGAGAVVSVAAGNSRATHRWVATPADTADALTVASSTGEPPSEALSAYYHQHDPDPGTTDFSAGATAGDHVDIIAPGCKVTVRTPSGLSELTGTSMAQPAVAGGAAVIKAETGLSDPAAIMDRIREYAAPVPAAGFTEAGNGMLDVAAAVDKTEPEETQEAARDGEAETRDQAHRSLSNTQGGRVARIFR